MAKIHPTAIVGKKAELGEVEVGPYAIIEDGARIGSGTKVLAHAYIASGTTIGKDCEVHMGAVIGHVPQHLHFKGAKSFLKIGDRNIFREYTSVHRGLEEGSGSQGCGSCTEPSGETQEEPASIPVPTGDEYPSGTLVRLEAPGYGVEDRPARTAPSTDPAGYGSSDQERVPVPRIPASAPRKISIRKR